MMRAFGTREMPVPARPVLDLSGPKLRAAFEHLVDSAEATGGVERYVGALALKASLFEEVLGKGRVGELTEPEFYDLAAFITPVRRRIGVWLGRNGFAAMRKRLIVKGEDTLVKRPITIPFDMVVHAIGMDPNIDNMTLAAVFDVKLEKHGHIAKASSYSSMSATSRPGVFVAGAATGPETIDDSIAQGQSAAMAALAFGRARSVVNEAAE